MKRIVVVGAGAAGLSVAFAVSSAGHEVLVLDPNPKRAAAHVAAGRLAPVLEAEFGQQNFTSLCLTAAKRWNTWASQLNPFIDNDSWYQPSGMLLAARDADDAASISRLADYQTSLGLDVVALSGRAARKLEPALSSRVRSGLLVRGDHMVDNRALLAGLRAACRAQGVHFAAEKATSAAPNKVETEQQRYDADAVILAAGAWASEIELEADLPRVEVHPVKGQILRLQGDSRVVFPQYPIEGLDVYLVPRSSGELVVGASVEDIGFDASQTAGAVYELLHRARELVPGVDEMTLTETSVGFRPATRDHLPRIGPLSGEGPFVIAGLFRNGILLSPIVADSALDWLEGRPNEALRTFPVGQTKDTYESSRQP